jgi:hypothetical protein
MLHHVSILFGFLYKNSLYNQYKEQPDEKWAFLARLLNVGRNFGSFLEPKNKKSQILAHISRAKITH